MKFNCVPDTKPFHAARRNFTFLSLLLLLLFIILVPIGYSFTRYVKVIIDHSNQPKLLYIGYNQALSAVRLEVRHSCILLSMIPSVIWTVMLRG